MMINDLVPNVTLPENQSGNWIIRKIEITKKQAEYDQLINSVRGQNRAVKAGIYTQLLRDNKIIMSDTPAEKRDHSLFVSRSYGHVLINGLGLGMVLQACLLKKMVSPHYQYEVSEITVIENSEDVIKMVIPHYQDLANQVNKKLNVIHCSSFEYKPPKGFKYDCIWHDIWDDICEDNLPEMIFLHRKYGHYCKGFQMSWCRKETERLR